MTRRFNRMIMAAVLAAPLQVAAADARGSRFDLGVRFDAQHANGEPADYILGLGVHGRFRLNDRWRVGLGVDRSEFDFKRPASIAGLPADFASGDVDAKSSYTALSIWIERVYGSGGGREWFWTVGFGGAAVDVATVSGPLQGGGTYTLSTSFDGELGVEEVILSAGAGLRLPIGDRTAVEIALRGDRHIADWEVVDRVSGATGRIDDFPVWGLSVRWSFRL